MHHPWLTVLTPTIHGLGLHQYSASINECQWAPFFSHGGIQLHTCVSSALPCPSQTPRLLPPTHMCPQGHSLVVAAVRIQSPSHQCSRQNWLELPTMASSLQKPLASSTAWVTCPVIISAPFLALTLPSTQNTALHSKIYYEDLLVPPKFSYNHPFPHC